MALSEQAINWSQVERSLDRLADLTSGKLGARDFYQELLADAASHTRALGGAVWRRVEGQLSLLAHMAAAPEQLPAENLWPAPTFQDRSTIPWRTQQVGEHSVHLAEQQLVEGVALQLLFPPSSGDLESEVARLLFAYSQIAEDYTRNRELDALRQRGVNFAALEQFALRVHGSLDARRIAFTIANEGQRLCDCDRLSVLIPRGRRWQVVAISGIATFSRRSQPLEALSALAGLAARFGETLEFRGPTDDLPPQLAQALSRYVDHRHSIELVALPLRTGGDGGDSADIADSVDNAGGADRAGGGPLALLVAERSSPRTAPLRPPLEAIGAHAATALALSREHQSLPLLAFNRGLRRLASLTRLDRLPVVALLCLVLLAGPAALWFLPAQLEIPAEGVLQPKQVHDIFAPRDGQVSDVAVEHHAEVTVGKRLFQMRDPVLELETKRVIGARATVEKQLQAAEAAHLRGDDPEAAATPTGSLAADESRLRQELANLDAQLELLRLEREQLEIKSPSGGVVLTWQLEKLLRSRPVSRGQLLASIAEVNGLWELHLKVADRHLGYLRSAAKRSGQPLRVSFVLTNDLDHRHFGQIARIAKISEPDASGRARVEVVATFDKKGVALRPGAEVRARIECGSTSLGRAWFYEFFDAVRRSTW